jgi:hypothetical protein
MSATTPAHSRLVKFSLLATALGILFTIPLLVRGMPYTFTFFMFLGQPLLLAGFVLFVVKVFQDLRAGKML